jgi:hypothetical protein
MGVKARTFPTFYSFLFFYFFIIYFNCDKTLINCDLVLDQSQLSKDLELSKMFKKINNSDDNSGNLNINSTQLKQIVMDGLSMTRLPDIDRVSLCCYYFFGRFGYFGTVLLIGYFYLFL